MRDDYPILIAERRVHVLDDARWALIGFVVLIPEPDAMLLDNVAVAPVVQGRGYDRRLIAFAEVCAREAGYSAIRFYTQEIVVKGIL